jgi:hypothetical protein
MMLPVPALSGILARFRFSVLVLTSPGPLASHTAVAFKFRGHPWMTRSSPQWDPRETASGGQQHTQCDTTGGGGAGGSGVTLCSRRAAPESESRRRRPVTLAVATPSESKVNSTRGPQGTRLRRREAVCCCCFHGRGGRTERSRYSQYHGAPCTVSPAASRPASAQAEHSDERHPYQCPFA